MAPHAPPCIRDVSFDEQHIVLHLDDGRTLTEPIARNIRVEKATPGERLGWVLTEDRCGVNWPALWAPAPAGMVSAWTILQDALYNHALGRLQQADWQLDALPGAERDLVALWRMEADINNGGFMQFLCNWGEETTQLTIAALGKIGAPLMQAQLRGMWNVVAHYGDTDEVVSLGDLPGMLTETEWNQLTELEESFWDYAEPLDRLVTRHFESQVGALSGPPTRG